MKNKGYPLPLVINPAVRKCFCMPVPNEPAHIRAFLGQLDMLARWYTWEKDEEHLGREVAAVWLEISQIVRRTLAEDCGCGGGSVTPDLQRFDEYGDLEVSYDNGVTWESGSNTDGRFNSPLLPPLPGTEEEKQCNTAFGIAEFLKSTIYDNLATVTGAAQLVTLIGSALALVASAGAAYPLVTALSGTIIAAGTGAVDAALTAEVWDTFACLIYCRLDESGYLSPDNYRSLQDDINDELTGIAAVVLIGTVQAFGPVGMTNSGRSMKLTGADCADCGCGWEVHLLGLNPQGGFIPEAWTSANFCAGSYSGGKLVGCCGGSGTGMRIRAQADFASTRITRVVATAELKATRSSATDAMYIYHGPTDIQIATRSTPNSNGIYTLDTGVIDITTTSLTIRASAALNSCSDNAHARFTELVIYGRGYNPWA